MDEDTDIEWDPDEALDQSTNEPKPAPNPTFAEVIGAIDVIKNNYIYNGNNSHRFVSFIDILEKIVVNNRVLVLRQAKLLNTLVLPNSQL